MFILHSSKLIRAYTLFIIMKMIFINSFLFNLLYIFSVFWDLYCAAPERRDTCEHSSEAKAFHDYVCISIVPKI